MISFKYFILKISAIFTSMILALGTSCENDNKRLDLNQNDTLRFSGTFKYIDSLTNIGTISLRTSADYYDCITSLPYGHGAGNIMVNESTIDFVDTLFFIIPAIYGPSFVLSGKYNYQFDGQNLSIKKDKESGNLIYELRLEK